VTQVQPARGFADQPFWGTRLEELGLGAHRRFPALDRRSLESGLREVLDPATVTRARDLGKALVAEDGAALRAADLVERPPVEGYRPQSGLNIPLRAWVASR